MWRKTRQQVLRPEEQDLHGQQMGRRGGHNGTIIPNGTRLINGTFISPFLPHPTHPHLWSRLFKDKAYCSPGCHRHHHTYTVGPQSPVPSSFDSRETGDSLTAQVLGTLGVFLSEVCLKKISIEREF